MIKGVTPAHLGPIWYNSEPSDVPYSANQFHVQDFFCHFLQQDGSKYSGGHISWHELFLAGNKGNPIHTTLYILTDFHGDEAKMFLKDREPKKTFFKSNNIHF